MAAEHSHVYTLLAYRPNGADYCGGYCYGSSESEFSMHFFTDADVLARQWAQLRLTAAKNVSREVQSTEFTLLVDGVDEDTWWQVHGDEVEDWDATYAPHRALQTAMESAYAALCEQEAQREAQRKAQQAQLEAQKRQQAKKAAERADRDAYARLHAKYGKP